MMKTLKFTVFTLLISVLSINLAAQKYGATPDDSIQCLLSIQSYQTEYRSKNYDAALPSWREVLKICPKAIQNAYIHGLVMMRYLIDKTTDPALKEARIDSLLMLYDKRMEYFNVKDKADLLYTKAIEIQNYRPDNHKAIYDAYRVAISANVNIDMMAVAKTMLSARELFENKEISLEEFTNIYTEMAEIADLQLKATPDDTTKLALKAGIESAFLTTDAANCENLIKVLGERFNANKDNAEIVKMVITLLQAKECIDSELYYEGVEAYNKLNPSPAASYGLARVFYSKNEKEKAMQYFKEATETETDNISKSTYFYEFGGLMLKEGKRNEAINYAKRSILTNPRNAKAYMLLGTAYAGVQGCGDDDVSKRAIYWVAVDQFVRAKQLDPSIAPEANKSINTYSQHFPTVDDAFFLNILDGSKYEVKCGPINETTIVRTKK
ncbi:MAG: tetratricopeptide repeat protein [Prevotellaceae bacterium]|jgi:tetratricopeptide (TPR) repeat protein|nr:tetratricopeptide repeat protein [Prevotellaceae bacterium]